MREDWRRAIEAIDLASIQELAAEPAVLDSLDRYGQTGLMLAVKSGRTEAVRLLIGLGAELNHTAKYHLSALMQAVLQGHVDIVQLLLEAGADRTLVGSGAPGFHDKTALDLAVDAGRMDIVKILASQPPP